MSNPQEHFQNSISLKEGDTELQTLTEWRSVAWSISAEVHRLTQEGGIVIDACNSFLP